MYNQTIKINFSKEIVAVILKKIKVKSIEELVDKELKKNIRH